MKGNDHTLTVYFYSLWALTASTASSSSFCENPLRTATRRKSSSVPDGQYSRKFAANAAGAISGGVATSLKRSSALSNSRCTYLQGSRIVHREASWWWIRACRRERAMVGPDILCICSSASTSYPTTAALAKSSGRWQSEDQRLHARDIE